MGGHDVRIKEWLAEYKALSEAELHTYASTIRNNQELIDALYDLLQREHRQEIMDPVCHQLFEFYRSSETEFQLFTLEFVPVLISAYLHAMSRNHKKNCSGIEACLLGIYNLDLVNQDGSPKIKTFFIPQLSKPSVYHEPYSQVPLSLTESVLSRHDQSEMQVVNYGPFSHVERMKASNRLTVLAYVLNCYNASIVQLSAHSHQTLCNICTQLVKSGFDGLNMPPSDGPSGRRSWSVKRGVSFAVEPRIHVNSHFLLEMISGLYYVMFNTHPSLGMQAIEAIHKRASYEVMPEVLLVTDAIRNALHCDPSGQPEDGPMGINVAISPSTTTMSFSKAAITNASFRTKKLPDDIPVPSEDVEDSISVPPIVTSDDVFDTPPSDRERRPSESEKLKVSSGPKISIKSVLKKSDKIKRRDSDSKPHVTLNTSVNGDSSEPEKKKLSVSIIQGQIKTHIDSMELKSYSKTNSDLTWTSRDSDDAAENEENAPKMNQSSSSHFKGYMRTNSNQYNTEV